MTLRARLAWIWTLLILVLCWLPKMYLPGKEELPPPIVINVDKFVHFGIFAVFGVLWMRTSSTKDRSWWILHAGIALAVISELGQANRFVNRDANIPDALADIIGVDLGIIGSRMVQQFQSKRLSLKTQSSETP